jgi:hypothetical protein
MNESNLLRWYVVLAMAELGRPAFFARCNEPLVQQVLSYQLEGAVGRRCEEVRVVRESS